MTAPRILLAPDARPEVGLGHASRCATLARALETSGAVCGLLASEQTWRAVGLAGNRQPGINRIDEAELIAAAQEFGADLVVLDGYGMPARHVDPLHGIGCRVLVIDDNGLPDIEPDLVVNPNAHAHARMYRTRSLIGPRYAMIRPAFEPLRARKRDYGQTSQILVCMGGSDPAGVSLAAAEGVLAAASDARLSVVLGPMADAALQHRLQTAFAGRQPAASVVRAPEDFPAVLACTDIAVLSGGVVLTEALHLGIPSIAITIADNQRFGVAAWVDAGAAIDAAPDRDSIASRIKHLVADATLRQRLGTNARTLVDGKGATRIAEVMLAMIHGARSA